MFIYEVGLRSIVPNAALTLYLYADDTVFEFEDQEDATSYKAYLEDARLNGKYPADMESYLISAELREKASLDVQAMRREDALLKLTPDEREMLGLS